jgi:hypothetical protein
VARSKNVPIKLKAGFVKGEGSLAASGRYVDGNWVRFLKGLPQKIGGFVRLTTEAFTGVARAVHAWNDLSARSLKALGTTTKLYAVNSDGTLADITPTGFPGLRLDPGYGYGWGVGSYGRGTWGTARSTSSFLLEPGFWSIDNFGKYLLAAPSGGVIHSWDPNQSPRPLATPLAPSQAPGSVRGFWTTPERFIIAYGTSSDTGGVADPMQLWWNAQGQMTVWTPAEGNSANRRRLTQGKKIVAGGALGASLSLIWTDTAVYRHQYTGSRFVFDTALVGTGAGLYGPYAFTFAKGQAFWAGSSGFHRFAGGLDKIPNSDDVAEWLLKQLRSLYEVKTVCFYNQRFNELWWLFVTGNDTDPGVYCAVSLNDYSWITGELDRTAAFRADPISADTRPVLASIDGYLYTHETGLNGNGSAINAWVESAPFEVHDGDSDIQVLGFMPDFGTHEGPLDLTVTTFDRSPEAQIDSSSDTVLPGFGMTDLRLAGRLASFKIRSNVLGGDFRLGKPKFEIKGGGTRR